MNAHQNNDRDQSFQQESWTATVGHWLFSFPRCDSLMNPKKISHPLLTKFANHFFSRQRYGTRPNVFPDIPQAIAKPSSVATTIGPSPFTDQVPEAASGSNLWNDFDRKCQLLLPILASWWTQVGWCLFQSQMCLPTTILVKFKPSCVPYFSLAESTLLIKCDCTKNGLELFLDDVVAFVSPFSLVSFCCSSLVS